MTERYIIEWRLKNDGGWNPDVMKTQMQWSKYKSYEKYTDMKNALKALKRKNDVYEYRQRLN